MHIFDGDSVSLATHTMLRMSPVIVVSKIFLRRLRSLVYADWLGRYFNQSPDTKLRKRRRNIMPSPLFNFSYFSCFSSFEKVTKMTENGRISVCLTPL